MIEKLLKEDVILINENISTWEEAIVKSGNLLLEDGKINERYIDSMINTVKKMGPYIVLAKGVAMPHGRPEDGVLDVGLSIVTLKNDIEFGNEDFDPVKIIIAVCATDGKKHLELLQDLSCLLDNENLLEEVAKCKTKGELISLLIKLYKE